MTREDTVTDIHTKDHDVRLVPARAEEGGADGAPAGKDAAAGPRLSPRLRRAMAAVLAALVVLALVALSLDLLVLRPRYDQVRAQDQARSDVVRVAERFAAQVNHYDVASIDGYQKRIDPLLTTKFRDEFKQAMKDIVASVKRARMTSKGEVLTSAVASLDPDSAQVLVVADAQVKTVYDTRLRHFRWQVSLVKVDGKWLVDDFSPVQ